MRRWAAGLACAFVLTLAAGCASHHDLTDGWPALPAATLFHPADHTCHDRLTANAAPGDDAPIPCAQSHAVETVAVGDLVNPDSPDDFINIPQDDAPAAAFQKCSRQADTFLGGDWRTGWLIMQPVVPDETGWNGGARWYRCDLAQISPIDGALTPRAGSLKGALRAGGTLRMACADPTISGEQVTEMHPVTCSRAHTAEFAGLWPAKVAKPADLSTKQLEKGCDATIAAFAALPDDGTITSRVGWLSFPPDDSSWQAGDRSIRCFLWLNGERMTGSYRHAGTGKLRIHYARR